jgi:hypothetical protein
LRFSAANSYVANHAGIAAWLIALSVILCTAAWAETPAGEVPRFGVHESYDRVVIGLPAGAHFSSQQSGSTLKLQFDGVGRVAALPALGHRAVGSSGGDGTLSIEMAPGTHAHIARLSGRVVIDVLDGAGPPAASPPSTDPLPATAGAADATPPPPLVTGPTRTRRLAMRKLAPTGNVLPMLSAAPGPAAVLPAYAESLPAPPPAQSAPAAQPVQTAADAPVSGPLEVGPMAAPLPRAAVTLLPEDGDLGGPAMLVPYGPDTGAAAFRRGGEAHIVFDVARPLDLSQLKDDSVFGGVEERLLPDGMHLRLKLPPETQIRAMRRPNGWALAVVHAPPKLVAITSHSDKGVLSLAAASPGRVVVLDDDSTGGKLLVGTQRVDGQYVPASHRSAEFGMPATWQGVVVEPVSDRLSLQPVRDGFVLQSSDGPKLSLVWSDAPGGAGADGRTMTRRFELPDLPDSVLHNRLTLAMRDAALTPKLSRFGARLRVAQAMLAEGMDVEARAVLHAAISDDPAHADDPDAAGLSAIASWLLARAGGAYDNSSDNFDPASLGNSDEAQFWQALFKASQPDVSGAAATLAVTWPLLRQYPAALRRRLAPDVGHILGAGGQDKALDAFLVAFLDPSLDLVRAALLQRRGKTSEALALLDAVAKRPDRLMRAQALRNGVELRLASKKIDVQTAAAALGRQLYAWRGGPADLDLRFRVSDLRVEAGQWRAALALLRETDGLFPDAHAQVHDAETRLVAQLLRGDSASKLNALDLVALADEASGLLSAADADTTLAPVLVDKLLALDLPARAEPILRRLFDHAATPAQKAELGVRLAGLLADHGDQKGALAVLAASDDTGLDSALVTRRGLLRAKLLEASGQASDALGVLSGVQGEPSVELQAGILEDRRDWTGAIKLLESLTASAAFAAKPDQVQRDLILRLANDESQAGDMAALRRLRSAQGARFASGPGAELFAVLTQEPIQAVGDLPRAGHELEKVRALPASLAGR